MSHFLIVDHRTNTPKFHTCAQLDEARAVFQEARQDSPDWIEGGSITLLEIGEASCGIVDQLTYGQLHYGEFRNRWVSS